MNLFIFYILNWYAYKAYISNWYDIFQEKPEVGVCGYSGRKFIQQKYYKSEEHGPSISYEEYLEQMKGDSRWSGNETC